MKTREKKWCMRAGFSFVEVMLSTFVLAVGISATLAVIGTGLQTTFDAQNITIASGLAQEGAELIQNVRDNNFACSSSGVCATADDGLLKFPASAQYDCRIDYNDATVFSYANPTNRATGINCSSKLTDPNWYSLDISVSNFYVHNGNPGKFKRRIFIVPNANERDIYSVVYWGSIAPVNTGDIGNCILANKCVYTRVKFVPWS